MRRFGLTIFFLFACALLLTGCGEQEEPVKSEPIVPIKIKMLVVLGEGWHGPIDLTVYSHHKPETLTALVMDEPLQIPSEMRTEEERHLYSMRLRRILEANQTYADQAIEDGDIVVLTDIADNQVLMALSEALSDLRDIAVTNPELYEESRADAVASALLKEIPWVGPALDALIFGPRPK